MPHFEWVTKNFLAQSENGNIDLCLLGAVMSEESFNMHRGLDSFFAPQVRNMVNYFISLLMNSYKLDFANHGCSQLDATTGAAFH